MSRRFDLRRPITAHLLRTRVQSARAWGRLHNLINEATIPPKDGEDHDVLNAIHTTAVAYAKRAAQDVIPPITQPNRRAYEGARLTWLNLCAGWSAYGVALEDPSLFRGRGELWRAGRGRYQLAMDEIAASLSNVVAITTYQPTCLLEIGEPAFQKPRAVK